MDKAKINRINLLVMGNIFKHGDVVFEIRYGWGICDLKRSFSTNYPISVVFFNGSVEHYTKDGKIQGFDFPLLSFSEYKMTNFSQKAINLKRNKFIGKFIPVRYLKNEYATNEEFDTVVIKDFLELKNQKVEYNYYNGGTPPNSNFKNYIYYNQGLGFWTNILMGKVEKETPFHQLESLFK